MNQDSSTVFSGKPVRLSLNYPFRIAVFSDLHAGSQYGLFPGDFFKTRFGSGLTPNEGQKILWEYFLDYSEVCKKYKPNMLIVLGDLIAGQNKKNAGGYLLNVDLEEQCDMATLILSWFLSRNNTVKETVILQSTPYHDSIDMSADERVALNLKDAGFNTKYIGEWSYIDLEYNNITKRIFASHHSNRSTTYPATAINKDILFFSSNAGNNKLPKVDIILRAHNHNYVELRDGDIVGIQLPAWQFFVPYDKAVKSFPMFQPDIGGLMLLFDEDMELNIKTFMYPNFVNPARFLKYRNIYGVEKKCLL